MIDAGEYVNRRREGGAVVYYPRECEAYFEMGGGMDRYTRAGVREVEAVLSIVCCVIDETCSGKLDPEGDGEVISSWCAR